MWPSTPLSVKSGMKPTMMIAAEKKIARLTSVAARKIVASFPLRPKGAGVAAAPLRGAPSARCRKMFSTMMTLASTMRPKSIAPTDSRLADSPRMTRMPIAKKRAKGMVDDTNEGAAQISQKNPLNEKNQNHAEHQVEQDSMGGQVDEIAAIVDAFDLHARRENPRRIDLLDLCFNTTDRR